MQDFGHLRTNMIFVQAHLEESLINIRLLSPLVKAAAAKYGSYGQPKQPCSAHSAGGYGQHKKPFSAIDLPLLPPPPLVSQVMEFLLTGINNSL